MFLSARLMRRVIHSARRTAGKVAITIVTMIPAKVRDPNFDWVEPLGDAVTHSSVRINAMP